MTVVVDDSGAPQRISVRQRLVLEGTGDYSFVVPAPLVDVVAAPGSDVVPGARSAGIVWQGFVTERRVLAADATLRHATRCGSAPDPLAPDDDGRRAAARAG